MSDLVYRIAYKNIDWKDWKGIDRLYATKGIATGVLRRKQPLRWDDSEKVWVTYDGQLIFKIQSSVLEWIDYGEK